MVSKKGELVLAIRLNYQEAAIRVCIDQVKDQLICGRIVSQRLTVPICFHDINDLVIKIDSLMEAQAFPQAFNSMRSFTKRTLRDLPAAQSEEELSTIEEVYAHTRDIITFALLVTSRRNSSWQGYIDWLDDSPKQPFSSALEFIKLVIHKAT